MENIQLKTSRGAFSDPLLMSMSKAFSVPLYTLIKLCYIKKKKHYKVTSKMRGNA